MARKLLFLLLFAVVSSSVRANNTYLQSSQASFPEIDELYKTGFSKINDEVALADSLIRTAWMRSVKKNYKKGIADGYFYKGCLFERNLMIDSAIYSLKRSIVLYTTQNQSENIPDAYGRLGLLKFKTNKGQQGLEYLMKGVQKAEEFGNQLAAIRLSIVLAMHHNNYTSQYQEALKYLKKAESHARKLEEKNLLAHIYLQYSITYLESNQEDLAASFAKKAISSFQALNSTTNATRSYIALANVYWRHEDLPKRLELMDIIENALRNKKEPLLEAAYEKLLAETYLLKGEYSLALESANRSSAVFEETGQEKGEIELNTLKYRILYAQGDIKKADSLFRNTVSKMDSLFSDRAYAIDSELRQKYELEAKQHKIDMQELEILHGNRFRYALLCLLVLFAALAISLYKRFTEKNRLNKLNELLLNEVNHRVKNNLQLLSSILHMQNRKLETQEAKELVRKCVAWMRTFSLIHDTLYLQNNLEKINMQSFLSQLCIGNETSSGELVSIQVHAPGIELPVDNAMHIGLIMNELIINSFKYAFNESKKSAYAMAGNGVEDPEENKGNHFIFIQMVKQENKVFSITYGDSGPGISSSLDLSKQKSMGMKLIFGLVHQMQGSVEYDVKQNRFHILVKANG